MEGLIHSIERLRELFLTRLDAPPYVLLLSGLLIGLSSGLAFFATFRIQLALWQQEVSAQLLIHRIGLNLIAPFAGVAGGLCIFLAAVLMTVGLPILPACILAFLATILTCCFGWLAIERKINRRLIQLYLAEQS